MEPIGWFPSSLTGSAGQPQKAAAIFPLSSSPPRSPSSSRSGLGLRVGCCRFAGAPEIATRFLRIEPATSITKIPIETVPGTIGKPKLLAG